MGFAREVIAVCLCAGFEKSVRMLCVRSVCETGERLVYVCVTVVEEKKVCVRRKKSLRRNRVRIIKPEGTSEDALTW